MNRGPTLQVCPPHLPSHFSTLLFMCFRLFTLSKKKTNSNCCTAALAVYLLLFSASYYLHSPSRPTTSGHATREAHVLIWTCWGLRLRLVVTWAKFQHRVVYYATDQWRKRLEACINAECGHSEHLLWHCLPDIPVATHHNRFFSATDDNPQLALFRASNVWKNATNL